MKVVVQFIRERIERGHSAAKTRLLRRFGYYIRALEANLIRVNRERLGLQYRLTAALARLEELEGIEAPVSNELTLENLYEIIKRNNVISKTELQEHFNSTYPTIQARLDSLEEEGYLEYVSGNRRFKILRDYP